MPPAPPPPPWSRRTETLLVVGFWAVLGTLSVVRRAVDPRIPGNPLAPDVLYALSEYALWAVLTPVVFALARRFPLERGSWTERLAGHLVAGLAVGLLVETVSRGVVRPLLLEAPPWRPPWTFRDAVLQLRFLDEIVIYVAVLAAGLARDALIRLRDRQAMADRLLADRVHLEAQLAEARLSALRMQLNPHFLFNTLNTISALVERDPAGVRTTIARLSSLLRRVLDGTAAPEVPLREEVAFLHDYLDIQRVRFGDRLDVVESVDPAVLDALVPPLLLQPLVENAVGHGVSRIEEGVGRIRVEASRDGSRLVLTIEDNGPGLGPQPAGRAGGVGLPNTRARLDALYGPAGTLTLDDVPTGGVRARVAFPYHTATDVVHAGDGAATLLSPPTVPTHA